MDAPLLFYREKLNFFDEDLQKLLKRKSYLGWLRLFSIVLLIVSIYLVLPYGVVTVIVSTIIVLTIFARLLVLDLSNAGRISNTENLITVCKTELQYLSDDYLGFEGGDQYMPPNHIYANDLDIFGRASVFQYVNRASGEPGQQSLAAMLSAPASIDEIKERQDALKDLAGQPDWLLQLKAIGRREKVTIHRMKKLEAWSNSPGIFLKFKPWRFLRWLLPFIIITITILFIADVVGNPIFYSTLLVFGVLAYRIDKLVTPVHQQLDKLAAGLDVVYASLLHIEKGQFNSALMQSLQGQLSGRRSASANIRKIRKILDRLDLRYNLVVSIPLNLFLLWNLQQVLELEKWKKEHSTILRQWIDTLAMVEALGSLATLHFNQPGWCFPLVEKEYFACTGTGIGHPLIPADRRVVNDISIGHRNEVMLITGSNMAGKSTYLRSIGVNVVLALAGAPVCAASFSISHVELISSMRVTDNLEESTSTFYAELKKLRSIIEMVNQDRPVFILLDEILRGTNSVDRHTGSVALVRQFIEHAAPVIIATHDLQLASLSGDYPGNIQNYHFDVQVKDEELYFDYKLKPGICNSMNASLLMKKIGIEI